jgi:hypothetical protein
VRSVRLKRHYARHAHGTTADPVGRRGLRRRAIRPARRRGRRGARAGKATGLLTRYSAANYGESAISPARRRGRRGRRRRAGKAKAVGSLMLCRVIFIRILPSEAGWPNWAEKTEKD